MLKFKKASADEVRAKRKEHVRDLSAGTAILKGFKAPPSWNDEARSAKFIMSSESVDRYRDIVVQSGLDTAAFERNPQGLLFHNSRSWPIGLWSDITKVLSGRPKRTEGVLNFLPEGTDDDADRAARHVKAGSMRTVSIGFIPDWDEVDFILDEDEDWTGGFRFNKSELIECSLVPVPAQPDALVKDAGGDFQLARDLIEDILDTYTKTPEGLLIPLDAYQEKYAEISGNRMSVVVNVKADEGTDIGAFVQEISDSVTRASLERLDDAGVAEDGIVAPSTKAADADVVPVDETEGLSEEIVKSLVEREMVFRTEIKTADKTLEGNVIAKSFEEAEALVVARGLGEKVIGIRVAVSEEPSEPNPEAEAVTSKDNTVSIKLNVESDLTETTKQVDALETKVDSLLGIFAKMLGLVKDAPVLEKKDPEIEVEVEVKAPPTEDEIAAIKARAAAVRERLVTKGMIAAE